VRSCTVAYRRLLSPAPQRAVLLLATAPSTATHAACPARALVELAAAAGRSLPAAGRSCGALAPCCRTQLWGARSLLQDAAVGRSLPAAGRSCGALAPGCRTQLWGARSRRSVTAAAPGQQPLLSCPKCLPRHTAPLPLSIRRNLGCWPHLPAPVFLEAPSGADRCGTPSCSPAAVREPAGCARRAAGPALAVCL